MEFIHNVISRLHCGSTDRRFQTAAAGQPMTEQMALRLHWGWAAFCTRQETRAARWGFIGGQPGMLTPWGHFHRVFTTLNMHVSALYIFSFHYLTIMHFIRFISIEIYLNWPLLLKWLVNSNPQEGGWNDSVLFLFTRLLMPFLPPFSTIFIYRKSHRSPSQEVTQWVNLLRLLCLHKLNIWKI